MYNKHNVGAVIVTYNPNYKRVKSVIESIDAQCEKIVIVDNGSANSETIEDLAKTNVEIIMLGDNCGIAKALNVGITKLQSDGLIWALTMDQDTVCPNDMVIKLLEVCEGYDNIGIACPAVIYEGIDKKIKPYDGVVEIKACMTSGSLTCIEAWRKVGGFEESYFIDFVDNEFCMKLSIRGYHIYRDNSISMFHQLGNTKEVHVLWMTKKYSSHAPWRYYYMVRNNIAYIKTYSKHLNVIKEYLKIIYIFAEAIIFEKERRKVLKYSIKGYNDAKQSIMGGVI